MHSTRWQRRGVSGSFLIIDATNPLPQKGLQANQETVSVYGEYVYCMESMRNSVAGIQQTAAGTTAQSVAAMLRVPMGEPELPGKNKN